MENLTQNLNLILFALLVIVFILEFVNVISKRTFFYTAIFILVASCIVSTAQQKWIISIVDAVVVMLYVWMIDKDSNLKGYKEGLETANEIVDSAVRTMKKENSCDAPGEINP